MNLSIGIIAASPTEDELAALFNRQLRTGLPCPWVFAEPSEAIQAIDKHGIAIKQILDPFERGKFHNWHIAARWLLDHTATEFILLANDGLEFSPDAGPAIMRGPLNHAGVGYLSLFTSELMAARQPSAFEEPAQRLGICDTSELMVSRQPKVGWCEVSPNRTCVGAEALVFTRQMLSAILDAPVQGDWTVPKLVEAHPESSHAIDAILADACGILGLKTFYHSPSLTRIREQPSVQDWRQGTESKAFGWPDAVAADTTEITDDDVTSEVPAES